MPRSKDVEYTVVVVYPGFGAERENAEQVLEEALEYLNTHREQPGLRFAPYVSATLEIVSSIDQAQDKLDSDDAVALMILHDLPDDERMDFSRECARRVVPVCHTIPVPDEPEEEPDSAPDKQRGFQLVLRKRSDDDEPVVHRIPDTVLTAPLEGEAEELSNRVWQLIAVMALGVMEHHWRKNPPPTMLLPE